MRNPPMSAMDMHSHPAHSHAKPSSEQPNFHAMLLFGEETAYLSHLPMFMSPHNYQAFFEVTLTKAGSDPFADYRKDREDTGTRMYSFAPTGPDFVLTDLLSLNAAPPRLTSFMGTIWRGHFEEGHFEPKGQPIIEGVRAQVTRSLHFQKLDMSAKTGALLEYWLLGKEKELYMAHVLTGPPDFDQVIRVEVTGHTFTDAALLKAVRVGTESQNVAESRLVPFEHVLVSGEAQISRLTDVPSVPVQIRAESEAYFETRDLQPM